MVNEKTIKEVVQVLGFYIHILEKGLNDPNAGFKAKTGIRLEIKKVNKLIKKLELE